MMALPAESTVTSGHGHSPLGNHSSTTGLDSPYPEPKGEDPNI